MHTPDTKFFRMTSVEQEKSCNSLTATYVMWVWCVVPIGWQLLLDIFDLRGIFILVRKWRVVWETLQVRNLFIYDLDLLSQFDRKTSFGRIDIINMYFLFY